MNIDEVVDFTYSHHRLLQKLITKQQLKKFLDDNRENIIEARQSDGKLIGAGFYLLPSKNELHFLSATIKEDVDGTAIMLRAIKDKVKEIGIEYVSWFNPELKFKRWKVKGGRQCQTQ